MHSDYWPEITAKLSIEGQHRYDDLSMLNDVERERLIYFYQREINDIRTQFYLLQEGYLPQIVWDTSTRGQISRIMPLAATLGRPCNRDLDLRAELNRIAAEEECLSVPATESGNSSLI